MPKLRGKVFPFERFPWEEWYDVREGLGWDESCEIPRLRKFRFHDLRHCTASWLVMAGASLPQTAKILGHKELATTQRYAHLSESSLADVMEKIHPISGRNIATTGKSAESESAVNPHKTSRGGVPELA